ncbi:hypothetical protein ABK040_002085 [Willaertia magna]
MLKLVELTSHLGTQPSLNDLPIINDINPNIKIKQISQGYENIALLTEDGDLYMYGLNDVGQCGLNCENFKTLQNFIKVKENVKFICCGPYHSILINNLNEIYSTGLNCYGQLGLGDYDIYHLDEFTKINFTKTFKDEKIKFIRCQYYASIIVTNKNLIYGCGNDEFGQLGGFTDDDTAGCTSFQLLDTILPYSNKEQQLFIKDIQLGYNHMLLLTDNGSIYGVGYNEKGGLGLGDTINRSKFTKINVDCKVKEIYCERFCGLFLNFNNELYVTGDGSHCKLGIEMEKCLVFTKIMSNVKVVFPFVNGTMALTLNNELFVSGLLSFNEYYMGFTKLLQFEENKFLNIIYFSMKKKIIVESDYKIDFKELKEDSTECFILNLKKFQRNNILVDVIIN